jgi:hypothetical protein
VGRSKRPGRLRADQGGGFNERHPYDVALMALTIFGAAAVTFMMLMYAFERRGRRFILAFACGCVLSSAYGFLAGTWPFGVVELVWSAIAIHRYRTVTAS